MIRFKDLSIKRKLMLVMMLTSCAALLLACLSFMTYELVVQRQTMAEELSTLAGIIADNSTAALSFRDTKAAEETLATLGAKRQIVAAALYGPDGRIFARYLRPDAGPGVIPETPREPGYRFETGRLTLFAPVLMDQDPIGTVFLQSDLSAMVSRIQRYVAIVLVVVAASTILALLLSSRLQRVISEPILDLVDATRQVAAQKNYAVRATRRSRDELGLLIDGFNDMLSQIQERDRALEMARDALEQRVEERTASLRRSEEKYRSLVANIPDVTWTSDSRGGTVFISPNVETVYGFTPEEISADPGLWFGRIHTADVDTVKEAYRGLFVDNRKFEVEYRIRRKDGAWIWLYDRTLGTYRKGSETYADGIFTDITSRKEAELELQKAKEAAEQASRAKSEFLANMSHEIRTPMNGIIGMTDLLLDTRVSTEQREYLDMVKSSSDALLTLINDILDFSKIEAGRLEIEPIDFSIRDSLDETLRILAVRAHAKGLELACHVLPEVPDAVVGDPGRLRQVLINLVGNAIKFTERGEVLVRVEVDPGTPERVQFHFAVSDTGIGIPEGKHQAIFEAFTQADGSTTRKYGGTGLGLTISAQLVEMMGGRIWVDSEAGRGSTFHFTVSFGLQSVAARVPELAAPGQLLGLPVLVVDDNATNRRILEEMFTSWRMRPLAVAEGKTALLELRRAAREETPFRLVVLDANMPGMDGFTVAEHIHDDKELRDLDLIMLTSGGQRGEAARCREVGITAYLTKPTRRSELLDLVMTVLHPPADGVRDRLITRHSLREERKRLHVLLVEDNPVNRALAVRLLERRGHIVTIARTGGEAVSLSADRRFDLALMDLQMPEMGGLEATAIIRKRETASGRHLPIIAMTAHALKEDRARCLAAGMDGYLAKPIQIADLFATIDGVLSRPPVDEPAPAPAAPAPVRPLPAEAFDRTALLARLEGDTGLLGEIVDLFLQSAPRLMRDIKKAIESKDGRALERAVHTLKGAVANFGARGTLDAALRLDELGHGKDLSGARSAFASLEKEMTRLKKALARLAEEHAA